MAFRFPFRGTVEAETELCYSNENCCRMDDDDKSGSGDNTVTEMDLDWIGHRKGYINFRNFLRIRQASKLCFFATSFDGEDMDGG